MKNKKNYAYIALMAIGIFACKKKDNAIITNQEIGNGNNSSNARVITNKTMADYVQYTSDQHMTEMNNGLYLYMEGMKEVFTERRELLSTMFNKIIQSGKNAVVITNFLEFYPTSKPIFNSRIADLCPSRPAGTDHARVLATEYMNYNGQSQYLPVMSLYNNGGCGNLPELNNYDFRMALGTDAPESEDENSTQIGKLIPCWHFEGGVIQLEVISESEARNSTIPVFIFSPGYMKNGTPPPPAQFVEGSAYQYLNINDGDGGVYTVNGGCGGAGGSGGSGGGGGGTTGGGGSFPSNSPNYIYHFGGHVANRFEDIGPSQYHYTFKIMDQNGNQKGSQYADGKFLKDIPVNYAQNNYYFSFDDALFTGPVTDNDTYYFVSYEHDWFASVKHHAFLDINNTILYLDYKATLSSDKYQAEKAQLLNVMPQSAINSNPNLVVAYTMNYINYINGHDLQRF